MRSTSRGELIALAGADGAAAKDLGRPLFPWERTEGEQCPAKERRGGVLLDRVLGVVLVNHGARAIQALDLTSSEIVRGAGQCVGWCDGGHQQAVTTLPSAAIRDL